MKIIIFGLGISGKDASLLAKKHKFEVAFISDDLEDNKTFLIENDFQECQTIDDIVRYNPSIAIISPGISKNSSLAKMAFSLNIEVISEIEFAYRLDEKKKLIAITGTNGKTTTVEMISHLLNKNNINACVAGNIGESYSKVLLTKKYDYLILELSSFQLEDIYEFKVDFACILNITEDHLERYKSFDEYAKTKEKLLLRATESFIVDTHLTKQYPSLYDDFTIENNCFSYLTKQYHFNEFSFVGKHNFINLATALKFLSYLKITPNNLIEQMQDFSISDHRFELVVQKKDRLIINDSKATNVASLNTALESCMQYNYEVLLIAGGVDKGMNFFFNRKLLQKTVKKVYLYGKDRKKLYDSWHDIVDCRLFDTFEDAVCSSILEFKSKNIVLLSPACASYDLFSSYQERGNFFKKIVKEMV